MPTIPAQQIGPYQLLDTPYADDAEDITLIPPPNLWPGGYGSVVTHADGIKACGAGNSYTMPDGSIVTNYLIIASDHSISNAITVLLNRADNVVIASGTFNITRTYIQDGKTVYYQYINIVQGVSILNVNPGALNPAAADKYIAWLMVYGNNIPDGYKVFYDMENCSGDASNPLRIDIDATVTNAIFYANPGTEFVQSSISIDGDGFPEGTPVRFNWNSDSGVLRIGPVTSDITIHVKAYGDPYADTNGTSPIPGGGSVGIPGFPGLTATSTGIIGLFAPSAAQMQLLAGYMWTDFGGQGSTEVDVLKEIVEAIKRSISNPLDYVIGLNIIPSQGLSIGAAQEIRFGYTNTGISMPRLSNQYFVVDCGSIFFDTVCGGTFLDYAPYSKFSIYLPYIGVKEIDANDCVGHTIGVYYHGDTVTGGITAYITKDGSVMYQFSGCCALSIPLSSDGWGSTISGAVQVATSIAEGAAGGGGIAGGTDALVRGAASVAANPHTLAPQVRHSGAISGGAGCMGVQYPFIIRQAVEYHSTAGFAGVTGYPSFYFRKLSSVSGYTVVYEVHLYDIVATQGEVEEIENLLKEGVIF